MARRPTPPGQQPSNAVGHALSLVRSHIPPVHPAGLPFIAVPLAIAALGRNKRWIRRSGLTLAAANAAFFRNPHRVPPNRTDVVVAAADGEVTLVDTATPPAELGLGTAPLPRVSIFLSVLDVHVQRCPVAGHVVNVVHQPGRFMSADLDEASDANERNSMIIRTPDDREIVVVQIAGLVARRIICDARPGDVLTLGETYGLIRFGSRVDTFLPAGSRVLVERGQRTIGAETVIAELP
ncbi:phosphatidylserine decarboxylase [Hoyosella altamirensis]|uniref:Phosphatidylserine decarboxylase proenzyme n=1 Tax=Hoyosella altamirensis TaxID=616997 RepID=A0A839RLF8_9ACTN|nr:phosphatidylserine decarboxylase [Hoyosella altamirensis]MBB3037545.1 phosphatidylserine decarboxylase [Hoyosella altamirensis]